jgi:UDP-N-acetylmuramoyl-L-alanyl-D-glutamate--2,6-diaminopimelate ligase
MSRKPLARKSKSRFEAEFPTGAVSVGLSQVLPNARFIACDDIITTVVRDDADSCQPGDLFVARLTPVADGHDHVQRAIARGARGIVAERIVPTGGVPLAIVPDSNLAFGLVAQALAGDPSAALRVIAVTGTSGKTTTTWLTAAVLAEAGLRVGVLSDLGCLGPDDPLPCPGDCSRPDELAAWLARLKRSGCTHVVMEVSSRMLAAHVLAGVRCDTVVVTNLGVAHLDEHGTKSIYHALKARAIASLEPGGCLVSGVEADQLDLLRRKLPPGVDCITAGLADDCDVRATPVEGSLFGRTVLASWGGQTAPLSLDTPVVPFVRDSLLAIAVGGRYRIPLATAIRGLEAAGCVPGRVERIDRGQQAAIFIDTPSSGHALAATLASLRRLTSGRLVMIAEEATVAGLGGSRFGPIVARHCDACIVAPGSVLDDDAGDEELAAYARIDRLLESLGPDDCLLALGGLPASGRHPRPPAGRFPLAMLVEAWLQLASEPLAPAIRRAA